MELELLFEINADIAPPPIVIPDTPDGTRVVVHVSGGKFEGPRLKGAVLASGGDWFLMRSDGVGVIDVRLVLKTDDSESIYMTYTGRAKLSAGGLTGINTAPVFAASTKGKYAWLNGVQAFAEGETTPAGVKYKVYLVK
ncbi:DUF3237 domain-containing protein [Candidatus Binatus sp.]|jgi:hypothetical protein|uniref:DUF3237 domain-containing protein n=1 Tax=Candidatus Binatus sp. TaxID=2811406 RepID=UPI003BCFFF97